MTPELPEDPTVAQDIESFKQIVEQDYLAHCHYRFDQVLAEVGFNMEQLSYLYAHPGETGLGNLITDAFRHAMKKTANTKLWKQAHSIA